MCSIFFNTTRFTFQCNKDDDTIELDIKEVSQSDHCEAKVVQIGSNTVDEAGPFVTHQSIAETEQQLETSKMERMQECDKGTIMTQGCMPTHAKYSMIFNIPNTNSPFIY